MRFAKSITGIAAVSALAFSASLILPISANATPFTYAPRLSPCFPPDNCRLPTPTEVPGKEYSNNLDVNDVQPIPNLDSEQNLAFDGQGGRGDSFDYTGSRVGFNDNINNPQVDALANGEDLFFDQVLNDEVWMLFSTGNNQSPTMADDRLIRYENPGSATGGVWATGAQVDIDANNDVAITADGSQIGNLMDVDGLEVWGLDGPGADDADYYSLIGDPVTDSSGDRVSVFSYSADTHLSTAAFYVQELADAVAALTLIDIDVLLPDFDLDAMMVKMSTESILFSLFPVATLDGGEIFTWSRGDPTASYLRHGGHLWDTDFDVMATYDTSYENIDALEAVSVPLPGTLPLLFLSGVAFLWQTGRRRRPTVARTVC